MPLQGILPLDIPEDLSRFVFSFNFDGLSGPFALMLAAEEGCKVRASTALTLHGVAA